MKDFPPTSSELSYHHRGTFLWLESTHKSPELHVFSSFDGGQSKDQRLTGWRLVSISFYVFIFLRNSVCQMCCCVSYIQFKTQCQIVNQIKYVLFTESNLHDWPGLEINKSLFPRSNKVWSINQIRFSISYVQYRKDYLVPGQTLQQNCRVKVRVLKHLKWQLWTSVTSYDICSGDLRNVSLPDKGGSVSLGEIPECHHLNSSYFLTAGTGTLS